MKRHSVVTSLYAQYLRKLLNTALTYAVMVLFVLFAVLQFCIGQQFFTQTGNADLHHFFSAIPYSCIICIPALAAVLSFKNRELCTPVTATVIAFAKWAALVTIFIFCTALTIVVPITVHSFGDVESAPLLCSYFGICCYLFASSALAVFITTLTKNEGGSFIITAVILAVMNSAHLVPVYVSLPKPIASVLRTLSFAWHFDAAGKGIIDTRDILFYFVTTVCFIFAAGYAIEVKRGRKWFTTQNVLYALAAVLLLLNNTTIYRRIDTTANKRFSITPYSVQLLSEVDEHLEVTYFQSGAIKELYPQVSDVREYLGEYCSQNKQLSLTVIDPSKNDGAVDRLSKYGIYAQQIQTAGRDRTSYTAVYSAIVISYLDKTEIIPFVLDTSTLEYDLTSRVAALVRGTKRTVQIAIGNELTLDGAYSYIKPWLESQGFTVVQSVLPSQTGTTQTLYPFTAYPQTPLLLIGTSQLTADDTESLEQFVLSGAKTFIATTPYEVDINGAWNTSAQNDKVARLLSAWGISFKKTLTADISNFRLTLTSDEDSSGKQRADTRTEAVNYPLWPVIRPQTNALNGMTTFWPCAIDLPEQPSDLQTALVPLLVTSDASWQLKPTEGRFETNPFIVQKVSEKNDEKGPFTIAVRLTGKCSGFYTTQTCDHADLIVMGDQYALSTMMLSYTAGANGDFRAFDFVTDQLLALEGQQAVLALKNRNYTSTALYKKSADDRIASRARWIAADCLIPASAILCLGICFALRRRRFNRKEEGAK